MEEMRGRNMVNNASGCGKGLIEEGDQLSIIIHEPKSDSAGNEWMEEKLRSLEKVKEKIHEDKAKKDQNPRIQRIPAALRGSEDTKKYYTPQAISIGPLHHHNSSLKQTESLKLKLATLFMMAHNIQKEDLYKKIECHINYLRGRYVEEDIERYNNQELTWIFLVDGCSTLHHIDSCINYNKLDDWKIKGDQLMFFNRDIFLLENQLPFKLLQLIMDSCPKEESEMLMKSIYLYIYFTALTTRDLLCAFQQAMTAYEEYTKSKSTLPTHLLHLLRNRLIRGSSLIESDQEKKETIPELFKHALELSELDKFPNLRSASELKDAGFIIESSKTGSIKDIRFKRKMLFGTLYLPMFTVDEATTPQFMNLVAYEMCPDFYNDLEVTYYLSFMDTLIDIPNDVKILRDAHVLINYIDSEEGVAELFKSFRTIGAMLSNPIYSKVQYEIQGYHSSTAHITTWITQRITHYFLNHWKPMAFIAAMFELAMSFIQALYAVKEKKK